jgi:UDP-N-acetylmuramoylalanine--D-glutamate ligase
MNVFLAIVISMEFTNKNIAVFGMGRSGLAALELLIRAGHSPFAISQGNPEKWGLNKYMLENLDQSRLLPQDSSSVEKTLGDCDIIVLSPGIPRDHVILKIAQKNNVPIISEIELAYQFLIQIKDRDIPIIAITGTNGKTTTVSLLGEMYKDSNVDFFIGGNIGIPFCDYIIQRMKDERQKTSIIILELSSFQLESMSEFYPDYAAILNIYPNHGERYENTLDYALAKWNIINRMNDKGIVFIDEELSIPQNISYDCALEKISNTNIEITDYDISKYKLIGNHNKINLLYALKLAKASGIELKNIQHTIENFEGVKHRIQFVHSKKNYIAYNDAKSTNWDATITALKSFINESPKRELTLILGGKKRGRGDSIEEFSNEIKKYVDNILLIGETTDDLAKELEKLNMAHSKCYTLEAAVKFCDDCEYDGWLLFSPSFPSFDQYQNYEKRGEHFIELLSN